MEQKARIIASNCRKIIFATEPVLVMYWKPTIRKQQFKKEILNCRKPPSKLPAYLRLCLFYNLPTSFCSIKLKEQILLRNVSE